MDSAIPPPSLYKYFSAARSAFFSDPVIRFTQKTSLNDPFELTKRWAEFAGAEVRMLFANHIRSRMEQVATNKGLVLQLFKEKYAKDGVFIGPDQMAEAAYALLTQESSGLYQQFVTSVLDQVDQLVNNFCRYMDLGGEEIFNKLSSELGIFSLSENAVSEQMWVLY
jgi:hypothetical protein